MNFDDTPDEAGYRAGVRGWIAANRLPVPETRRRRDATPEWLALARAWQAIKADAGHVGIASPKSWHGQDGTVVQAIIFAQEEITAGLNFSFFDIGLNLCVPTIGTFGDQATIDALVTPTLRADKVWCQLFSEPSAGSDLAGIGTRAVADGEHWAIDGQKVWNSVAQFADYGLLLARTNPDLPKHKGLTMFWIDMRAPGVEVRPIQQMSGMSNFNEVFLNDVRVPDSQRLGPVDGGWVVAMTTLMNERVSVADVGAPEVGDAIRFAAGAADHPAIRATIVDHFIRSEGVRLTRNRLLTAISRGEQPGPENAILKLVAANEMQGLAREALLARGPMGMSSSATMRRSRASSTMPSPGHRAGGLAVAPTRYYAR